MNLENSDKVGGVVIWYEHTPIPIQWSSDSLCGDWFGDGGRWGRKKGVECL